MSERTVTVWGKKIAIQVYEEHKTVWKATGTYKGEVIEVTGGNIDEVVKLWRDAATYRGMTPPARKTKRGRINQNSVGLRSNQLPKFQLGQRFLLPRKRTSEHYRPGDHLLTLFAASIITSNTSFGL